MYLVRLVLAIGVADLRVDILLLVEHVITDTSQICPLQVRVQVHFNHAVADGILEFLLGAAGATMEDEENGLVIFGLLLLLDVLLVLGQEFRVQLDIAVIRLDTFAQLSAITRLPRLVDTVYVTKTSSDGKVGRNRRESLVNLVDVFWLGVQRVVINRLVVDAILFSTSDTDLHL